MSSFCEVETLTYVEVIFRGMMKLVLVLFLGKMENSPPPETSLRISESCIS